MGWRFVVSLLFALVVAVFAIQNASSVNIKFISWQLSISEALVILISAIFGAMIVLLLSLVQQIKLKATIRSSNKKISSLENENQQLMIKVEEVKTITQDPEHREDDL